MAPPKKRHWIEIAFSAGKEAADERVHDRSTKTPSKTGLKHPKGSRPPSKDGSGPRKR
jgi:hypothetical protein